MLTLFAFAAATADSRVIKSSSLHGSVRTDVTYVGETTSEFRPTSVFFERIDAYTLTNVRLRLADADATWNVDL